MSENEVPITTTPNSTALYDNDYYGPLIDSYIKTILKSRLLLDEDLELLLSIAKFRNFPERSGYRPSLTLLTNITSVLGSSILAKKLGMPLVVIPSIIAAASFAVLEFKDEKRKRDNKQVVEKLLEVISKVQKLGANVTRYMKTRCDLGKAKDQEYLILYANNVEEFMRMFIYSNQIILEYLLDNLKAFTRHSPMLQEDFVILEHLRSKDILEIYNLCSIENCLEVIHKIHDINILIFSKLLCYIGVVFYSQTLTKSEAGNLVNKTLPNTLTTLLKHHEAIKKQFVALRLTTNKKSEIKSQNELGQRTNISTKLQTTLVSSVNNLSVILEKSQNVLEALENGTDINLPQIGNAIVDLRNHTFAAYESLDLLCRLHGIISNTNTSRSGDDKIANPFKKDVTSQALPTLNYDDSNEPLEEKFELYIGNKEFPDEQPKVEYEDQSAAYLSLMLRELRQSLKQHERFIEAKNKRDDDDEEELEIEKRKSRKEQQSLPKFDLNALKDSDEEHVIEIKDLVIESKTDSVVSNIPVPVPAPPPPPLPSFTLSNLEQESGQVNARSMLENIKTLSSQRSVREDVFGDSDVESDSSD